MAKLLIAKRSWFEGVWRDKWQQVTSSLRNSFEEDLCSIGLLFTSQRMVSRFLCPGLPGCWTQGATEEEAIENIKDAIREYLAVVDEQLRGERIREIDLTV